MICLLKRSKFNSNGTCLEFKGQGLSTWPPTMATKVMKYSGCNFFRQRLVLATLSSRPVRISEIRADADEPGLRGKPWCK